MLVLARKPGQSFVIRLNEGVGNISAAELFADGPIEVVVTEVQGNIVKLGIKASRQLVIMRDELSNNWQGPRVYKDEDA